MQQSQSQIKNSYRVGICVFYFVSMLFSFVTVSAQDHPKPPVIVPAGTPTIITEPAKSGGSYKYKSTKGVESTIQLLTPATLPLPVLKNAKGEAIRDDNANPFYFGEGGISDFTNYTTDNGLAIDAVLSSCMDHSGNLWIGTSGGGVSRYDGKSFTNYTKAQGLADNNIQCIFEDRSGNIWFGTDAFGVSRYDGKSFTNYTTLDGLPNNNVRNIMEDKAGNIWFATQGGASRFDMNIIDAVNKGERNASEIKQNLKKINGKYIYSFTNFTTAQGQANNDISIILEDKKGDFWFGTAGGVRRYPATCIESINENKNKSPKTLGKTYELPVGCVTIYTTEQGLIFNDVTCMLEDKKGNIWIATTAGISKYDGNRFYNYTHQQGLLTNYYWQILEDKKGDIWLGSFYGLSMYNGETFTNYTKSQGLANNCVYSILKDKCGNLWFGTFGGGLSRLNGNAITSFTVAQGLPNNNVWGITEDKSGNLWFGTQGGVSRLNTNQSSSRDNKEMVNAAITKTKSNLKTAKDKAFTNYTMSQGLGSGTVRSVLEDKIGNIWFGTNEGISRYDGNRVEAIERGDNASKESQQDLKKVNGKFVKTFTNYTTLQGLVENTIRCMIEDKDGNLWFGTNGGVSCFDGKTFINYTTDQGLGNNIIRSMLEDKSRNIWFATEGGGVSRFNPSAALTKDGKAFTNYTAQQGLANNAVLCILEDAAGILWFGTNGGGVSRFDGKDFINYTKRDGLPDDVISQLVVSKFPMIQQGYEDCLVFGTNSGLAVLTGWKDKNELFIPFGKKLNVPTTKELKNYTPVFEIYNSSTGYPIKDVNFGQNAMYKDSKGIIWVATGSDKTGLVRFDPSSISHNPDPLPVFIQNIKINEENICWNNLKNSRNKISDNPLSADSLAMNTTVVEEVTTFGKSLSDVQRKLMAEKFSDIQFDSISKFYFLPKNLILPYKHNNVTFDFTAIEPSKPYLVRYQYILEGYSNEWSPLSNKTTATFGNIHEGNYIFRLKALSFDGIWSKPVSYSFKVLPPFYRTWWAYCIYLIVISLSLFSFYLWRTSALRKDKELLEQVVKERTSEILKQNIELEKLSIVASETDNGVLICGPKGEIEWCNSGLTRLLGYTLDDLKKVGKTLEEISASVEIKSLIHQSIENKKPVIYQTLNTTKDGRKKWIQSTLTPILNELGNVKKLVVIDIDITELKQVSEEIRKKNQKITDSIDSALLIQQAILPSKKMLRTLVPDSTVFFQPKDIVSGDFYWAHAINEHEVLLAAVDCTGHGVPGAFMSIMGYDFLEQIVKDKKITTPSLILNELHHLVGNSFKQTSDTGFNKAGMDIAMCKIDYQNQELEYAGAHNSLCLIRNGILSETKADNRSIGGHSANETPFFNHKIKLRNGDCFYIYSDGFADQKGGPLNKKFYYQPFRDLLVTIHQLSSEHQHEKLDKVFSEWKGDAEQTDDILVLGVAFSSEKLNW